MIAEVFAPFEKVGGGEKVFVGDGRLKGFQFILKTAQGMENLLPVLLEDFPPHHGMAGSDPGGVAQSPATEERPAGWLAGQKRAEDRGQKMGEVADMGDNFVVFLGIQGGHVHADRLPQGDNLLNRFRGGVEEGGDQSYPVLVEIGAGVFKARFFRSRHGMGADKRDRFRKHRPGGAADQTLDAPDVGDQRAGGEMGGDRPEQVDNMFHGGAGDHQIGSPNGFLGGAKGFVAPRVRVPQGQPDFRSTGPGGDTAGQGTLVKRLAKRGSEKTGTEDSYMGKHTLTLATVRPLGQAKSFGNDAPGRAVDEEIDLKESGKCVLVKKGRQYPFMKSFSLVHSLETIGCLVLLVAFAWVVYSARDFRQQLLPEDQFLTLDLGTLLPQEVVIEDMAEIDLPTLRQRSDQLEERARVARVDGRLEEAVTLLDEARTLQEEINRRNPASRFADRVRSTALGREIENWRAEPFHLAAMAAREEARVAMAEGQYSEARESLHLALEQARILVRHHSRSRFYNPNFVRSVEAELREIETMPLVRRRDEALTSAREAVRQGDLELAQNQYIEARQTQDMINLDFPASPHVSMEKWDEIDRERQSVLSREVVEEIETTYQQHQNLVLAGDWSAAREALVLVGERLEFLRRNFPESAELDGRMASNIDFLLSLGGVREELVEEILGALREVPGQTGVRMLAHEVRQGVFEQVTGRNPSRQTGADLPVDSVSWPEAREFAEKVAVVLARPVRLPTEEEFLAAAGPAPEDPAGEVWMAANSAGRSHPVTSLEANPTGFYHLRGNVAEWVNTRQQGQPLVLGGSYNSSPSDIAAMPREVRPETFRARTVGFRLVVLDR